MSYGMIIGHNLGSMNALSALDTNGNALQSALQKLSTGKRINSAADDAAGLAISQKMQSQINGLNQASQNAQDGISLIQTAEGALNETQSILQRMRDLAVQSSNDTNTTDDRTAMQQEVTQLTQEIDRIANTTQFNTKNLLNGGAGIDASVTDSTGATSNTVAVLGGGSGVTSGASVSLATVQQAKAATVTIGAGANNEDLVVGSNTAMVINGVTVNLTTGMTGAQVEKAINAVSGQTGVTATYTAATSSTKGQLALTSSQIGSASDISLSGITITAAGAATDTFESNDGAGTPTYSQVTVTNTSGTSLETTNAVASNKTLDSRGIDATVGTITDSGTGNGTVTATSSGNLVTLHGGNVDGLQFEVNSSTNSKADGTSGSQTSIKVNSNNSLNLQIGANQGQTMNVSIGSMTSASMGIGSIDLTSVSGAESAISTLDSAISTVSSQRANLGAYQNRLEHTINNLGTSSNNLTTAEAGITDVNMAQGMAEYTKDNVLQQAAVSMLAQANQQPQLVLKLLG